MLTGQSSNQQALQEQYQKIAPCFNKQVQNSNWIFLGRREFNNFYLPTWSSLSDRREVRHPLNMPLSLSFCYSSLMGAVVTLWVPLQLKCIGSSKKSLWTDGHKALWIAYYYLLSVRPTAAFKFKNTFYILGNKVSFYFQTSKLNKIKLNFQLSSY